MDRLWLLLMNCFLNNRFKVKTLFSIILKHKMKTKIILCSSQKRKELFWKKQDHMLKIKINLSLVDIITMMMIINKDQNSIILRPKNHLDCNSSNKDSNHLSFRTFRCSSSKCHFWIYQVLDNWTRLQWIQLLMFSSHLFQISSRISNWCSRFRKYSFNKTQMRISDKWEMEDQRNKWISNRGKRW